jgi:hypothetical protein
MAARKAALAFAIREALALYDQALEAAGHSGGPADPRTVIEIHRAKSTLHFMESEFDRARAEAEQVAALARQHGDRLREAKALSRVAWEAVWERDLESAIARAEEAIQVAGPSRVRRCSPARTSPSATSAARQERWRRPARRSIRSCRPAGRAS